MMTLTDRCDRCGSQAYIVAFFSSSELMFCRHHGRKHMAQLVQTADDVFDLSEDAVTQAPS